MSRPRANARANRLGDEQLPSEVHAATQNRNNSRYTQAPPFNFTKIGVDPNMFKEPVYKFGEPADPYPHRKKYNFGAPTPLKGGARRRRTHKVAGRKQRKTCRSRSH